MSARKKAIILKNFFPLKQKLSVLDEHIGHIEVFFSQRSIIGHPCHGALITYERERGARDYFRATDIEVMAMPFWWAQRDIVFFHQLLELTQFFLPLEACMPEIFHFLCEMYEKEIENETQKKIVLCRLLYLLGLCPDNAPQVMSDLFSLISSSCDIMLNENMSKQLVDDLDTWLACCISMHPFAHKLKTITLISL